MKEKKKKFVQLVGRITQHPRFSFQVKICDTIDIHKPRGAEEQNWPAELIVNYRRSLDNKFPCCSQHAYVPFPDRVFQRTLTFAFHFFPPPPRASTMSRNRFIHFSNTDIRPKYNFVFPPLKSKIISWIDYKITKKKKKTHNSSFPFYFIINPDESRDLKATWTLLLATRYK